MLMWTSCLLICFHLITTRLIHGHQGLDSPRPLQLKGKSPCDGETCHVEYIYEMTSVKPMKGVYFLAHGCVHRLWDWFERSSDCPRCIGLPVERTIVNYLVHRGYSVVSLSNQQKCWSKYDIEPTIEVIEQTYFNLNLTYHDTPLYMLGASSGGAFIGMLSNFLRLNDRGFQVSGIIPQIMPIMGMGPSRVIVSYPPVAYIYMERDPRTIRTIEHEIKILNSNDIPCKSFMVTSKPVNKDYFVQYSILTHNDSEKLVEAFKAEGIVDADYKLLEDPKSSSNWRHVSHTLDEHHHQSLLIAMCQVALTVLPNVFPENDTIIHDESPVHELLKLAWAYHEISADFVQTVRR